MGIEGKVFCITGKIEYPGGRSALMQYISEKGGLTSNMVTSSVDYLITTDPYCGSNKNRKAKEFGVKPISEEDFIRMCEEEIL